MGILVLGNGFDLAHNLPTYYSDFLDFVCCYDNTIGDYSENLKAFVKKLKSSDDSISNEVKALLSKKNTLLRYFLSLYKDYCKKGKKNWVDFESEILHIVKLVDEAVLEERKKQKFGKKNFSISSSLKIRLRDYLSIKSVNGIVDYSFDEGYFYHLAEELLDDLNKITRLLEIYLFEYVEKIVNVNEKVYHSLAN